MNYNKASFDAIDILEKELPVDFYERQDDYFVTLYIGDVVHNSDYHGAKNFIHGVLLMNPNAVITVKWEVFPF